MIADQIIEISQPAPAQVSKAIAIWSDTDALRRLKAEADKRGWTSPWAKLGGQTWSPFVAVADNTPPGDIQTFIRAVNSKKFGNLTAGYARIGR